MGRRNKNRKRKNKKLQPPKLIKTVRRKINDELRDQIKLIYNYRCIKCGYRERSGDRLTIHHLKKVENGGTNEIKNLCCMCNNCHVMWHTKYEGEINFWDWVNGIRN